MEEIIIYLLKSSGLLLAFFVAYHFLLRKETFFVGNRWFLVTGLITSALLPLFFIKKVIFVERPKISINDLLQLGHQKTTILPKAVTTVESIDWLQIAAIGYGVVSLLLILKVVVHLFSVFKLLKNKNIQKENGYSLIDIKEGIVPFSFFNYIVFNSSLYASEELQNILSHEKVHSKQKHSIDVLVAHLFTAIFWINPIVWLYKKAIIQNLEFIADYNAIQHTADKKAYQKTLLKVVSHQSCLPITNHFYQSLIKKRIVMLNKNQSHNRNSWKYAVVIPAIIAFVFLFQVKVVAQEKISTKTETDIKNSTEQSYVLDYTDPDEGWYSMKNEFVDKGIQTEVSNIKRNKDNKITAINIVMKSDDGRIQKLNLDQSEPINAVEFYISKMSNGKWNFGVRQTESSLSVDSNFVPSFFNNSKISSDNNDGQLEKKISYIESITDEQIIFIDGKRSSKEALKKLDPSHLLKIETLSNKKSLKKYNIKSDYKIINITTDYNILKDVPPPPPPPTSPIARVASMNKLEIKEDKNPLMIINGKEYFLNDLKGYSFKCDGGITHYFEKKAIELYGEKAKDGVIIFNGTTKLEKVSNTQEIQDRKPVIFSNDNGDDIVFISAEKSLKLPGYPSVRLNDDGLVLVVNGVQKTNPSETLNQMNLQNVKSVRVYDEKGKETPGNPIRKIVITTK